MRVIHMAVAAQTAQPVPTRTDAAMLRGRHDQAHQHRLPGRLAAVLYGQGCPWRCGYCHNPELLDATTPPPCPGPRCWRFSKAARACSTASSSPAADPRCKPPCPPRWPRCAPWAFKPRCTPAACTPNACKPCCPARLGGPGHQRPAARLRRHHAHPRQRRQSLYRCVTCSPAAWRMNAAPPGNAGLFSDDLSSSLADTLADAGVSHWRQQECRRGVASWGL